MILTLPNLGLGTIEVELSDYQSAALEEPGTLRIDPYQSVSADGAALAFAVRTPTEVHLVDLVVLAFSPLIRRYFDSLIRIAGHRLGSPEFRPASDAQEQTAKLLRRTQRMEVLGHLAGGMAHDFNNLLLTMMGHCEFAMEALPPGSPAAKDLLDALAAGRRAARLSHRMLALGRRRPHAAREWDLGEIVAGVGKLLRRIISETIRVDVPPVPEPLHVEVDRSELEQVLVSLAVNARDAMPEGGSLRITAGIERAAELPVGFESHLGRECAVVSIEDSGTGMDAATVARICDPFFTTKPAGQGTGLGVPLSTVLVSRSGGWLEVSSTLGQGTKVRIHLPLAGTISCTSVRREEQERPLGSGERILIVEDDEGVGMVVKRTLERSGYQVQAAGNGLEAIDALAKGDCDLMITDLVMPQMCGDELARRIRNDFPELPILVCSGYLAEEERKGVVTEPVAWLAKPISPQELCRSVHALLQRSGGVGA